ncbi:MAG: NAD-dependent epimerase/dehydratase family protein [Oceanococcus sp.]|nr:MAG: NAD-dependent epimerase/dehydratase family protein [Oceanococcus sp.]
MAGVTIFDLIQDNPRFLARHVRSRFAGSHHYCATQTLRSRLSARIATLACLVEATDAHPSHSEQNNTGLGDMQKQVTVTGGGGRLGCALVRTLLENGLKVRVLEPASALPASLAGLNVELFSGSVLDPAAVAKAIEGASVVYHLAAKIDLDRDLDGSVYAVNVEGTRQVAEACLARDLRLVHCSSHHALDLEPLSEPLDESRPLAVDHKCTYHRSKARAEQLVHELIRERALNAVVVNPGTLVGPLDFEPSLFGQGMLDLYHGKLPALLNIATDCADVRDVAQAIMVAAQRGRTGERYLLSGKPLHMREIAALWSDITGCQTPAVFLPRWFGWFIVPFTVGAARIKREKPLFTPNMLRASVANDSVCCDKAARELDYQPRPVEDSLRDAFAFYQEQGWA